MDDVIALVLFSLFLSISIWGYRFAKKKEDRGEVVMPPSGASIGPIVVSSIFTIIYFFDVTGLWDLLSKWLETFEY